MVSRLRVSISEKVVTMIVLEITGGAKFNETIFEALGKRRKAGRF